MLIAGALALKPELLIADEPVSSLDASIRGEILALLLKLRAELGLGVLVVTHDLGLAWNIADRTAVMYLGRIVEAGPTEEVLAAPQHPYTQALLSVVPEMERLEPVVLEGEVPDPTRIPRGCRFHPRCPALASGAADAVEEACRTLPLAVLPASEGHQTACHLVAAREEVLSMSDLAGGAAAGDVRRPAGVRASSATSSCTASGSASAAPATSGSTSRAGSRSSTSWGSRCWSPATTPARCTRRTTSADTAGRSCSRRCPGPSRSARRPARCAARTTPGPTRSTARC